MMAEDTEGDNGETQGAKGRLPLGHRRPSRALSQSEAEHWPLPQLMAWKRQGLNWRLEWWANPTRPWSGDMEGRGEVERTGQAGGGAVTARDKQYESELGVTTIKRGEIQCYHVGCAVTRISPLWAFLSQTLPQSQWKWEATVVRDRWSNRLILYKPPRLAISVFNKNTFAWNLLNTF